ncbi:MULTISPECIES: hypothetical protein [unclassified Geodermatophilus]
MPRLAAVRDARDREQRAVAAGPRAGLLGDAGWWQTPLWRWAAHAVVIHRWVAAERLALPVEETARRVAGRHGLEFTS